MQERTVAFVEFEEEQPRSVVAATQFAAESLGAAGLAMPDCAMKPFTMGSRVHAKE